MENDLPDQLLSSAARIDAHIEWCVRHQWDVTVKFMLAMLAVVAAAAAFRQGDTTLSSYLGYSFAGLCVAAWSVKCWWQWRWHVRMMFILEQAKALAEHRDFPPVPAPLWTYRTLQRGIVAVLLVSAITACAAALSVLMLAGIVG